MGTVSSRHLSWTHMGRHSGLYAKSFHASYKHLPLGQLSVLVFSALQRMVLRERLAPVPQGGSVLFEQEVLRKQ